MTDSLFTYKSNIKSAISSKIKSQQIIEDLTQDVFEKAWINSHRFNPQKGTIKNWLITIAKNTVIDFLRVQKNHIQKVEFDDYHSTKLNELSSLEQIEHDELSYHLCIAIKSLSERDQLLVKSFYFKRLKHKEIARELGVGTAAVGTMIKRCNTKIKKDFSSRGLAQRDF
jgi:RNA polymerase sigma-70 factor (ECF subfamily)